MCKQFYLGTLAISQKPIYTAHLTKNVQTNAPKEKKIQYLKTRIECGIICDFPSKFRGKQGRPIKADLTQMSLVLTLLENNDPFDTVVYNGGSNGEGSEEGLVEQQVPDIGFSVRRHYRTTAK